MQAARVSKEVYSSQLGAEATSFEIRHGPLDRTSSLYPPAVADSIKAQCQQEEQREMGDLRNRALRELQSESQLLEALEHGRSLRGKSAKAIEYQLKSSALVNLSRSEEVADIRKWQRDSAANAAQHDEMQHQRMMEQRSRMNLTDLDKITEPLQTLSHEMKSFEQKSAHYFLDKRCAPVPDPAPLNTHSLRPTSLCSVYSLCVCVCVGV